MTSRNNTGSNRQKVTDWPIRLLERIFQTFAPYFVNNFRLTPTHSCLGGVHKVYCKGGEEMYRRTIGTTRVQLFVIAWNTIQDSEEEKLATVLKRCSQKGVNQNRGNLLGTRLKQGRRPPRSQGYFSFQAKGGTGSYFSLCDEIDTEMSTHPAFHSSFQKDNLYNER